VQRILARLCRPTVPGCPATPNRTLLRLEDGFGVLGGGVSVAVPRSLGQGADQIVLTLGQV
jgi:hypothetical protein